MRNRSTKLRSFVALLLCLMMLIGTAAGCSGKQDADTEEVSYEEMDRFQEENAVHADYRADGSYTVTFSEGNLFYGEDEPGDVKLDIDRNLTLDAVTQDDFSVVYAYEVKELTQEEYEAMMVSGSDEYVIDDYRGAQITSFSNDGGVITVSFVDPDAAVNHTDSYLLYIERMAAGAVLTVDFEDHSLTADIDKVYTNADGVEVNLTVAEGNFAQGISADDIALGGSFEGMTVESLTPEGYKLGMKLTGSLNNPEEMAGYMPGTITVSSNGFENGHEAQSVSINVGVPTAGLSADELVFDGKTAVVPLRLDGIDTEEITPDDISFESGAEVTDVQTDGNRLLITVKADEADDIAGQITVGDLTVNSGVTHAVFYPFFDFIAADGDNLEITLLLQVSAGVFADNVSAEMITLSDDFAGGSVISFNKTDDTNAELVISVPANGQTDEEYDVTGTVTLAQGALIDTWGESAPEYSYTRRYVPDELGRDTVTSAIDYTVKGLKFVDVDAKEVGEYSKAIYELIKSGKELDVKGVAKGVKEILKLAGVFSGGGSDLAPNLTVAQQVEEVKNLITKMDQKLDKSIKLQYEDLLQPYDNAMKTLDSDCNFAQTRIEKALELMRERGMEIPGENASDAELMEFNARLVKLMEDEEKAGNGDFKNFTTMMGRIENNFLTLTNGLTNEKETNMLTYYDDMWAMYFNWDTQAAYMRKAYRTNCEFAVKRSYNMLSIYYQIPKYPDTYKNFTERFAGSLKYMEEHPGQYPRSWYIYEVPGYSPVWTIHHPVCYSMNLGGRGGISVELYGWEPFESDDDWNWCWEDSLKISDDEAKAYKARLHGQSIYQDIMFAYNCEAYPFGTNSGGWPQDFTEKSTCGIGLRGKWENSKWRIKHLGKIKVWNERVLKWNGDIKTINTYDDDYRNEDQYYVGFSY